MNDPSARGDQPLRIVRRYGRTGVMVLLGALGLLALTRPAWSATEAERLEALRDLQEGNRLFDAGDYLAALARFEGAYAKVPSSKLLFNFGQVHRRLGRIVEALDFYERYLAETASPPPKLRAEALQHIGELQKLVASIEIRSDAAGHEVTVDGRSYGPTPLKRPVRVLPGSHQIVVVRSGPGAAGAPPFVEKVVAAAGQPLTVDAHVSPPIAAAAAGPNAITAAPAEARQSAGLAVPRPTPPAPSADAAGAGASATPGVPAVSASSSAAADANPEHLGRLGLRLRTDIDRALAGAGVAAAVDFGVLERLSVSAGGFRWPVEGRPVTGISAGLTAYFLGGAVRPLLDIEAQLYFQTGAGADAGTSAHFGARAAAGVQWDMADHAGLYAMAGGQYTSTEIATEDGKLFFVPSLGLHLRL